MRARSLRTILATTAAALTGVALVVSLTLVISTSRLHAHNHALTAAVESLRLTHQAAIELLLHARSDDPLVRKDIAASLLGRLDAAAGFVTSAEEAATLDAARRLTRAYLDAPPDRERHAEAYAALTALVDINVVQARASHRAAARWDRMADVVGLAAGVLVVLVTGALFWWVRARAFQPMVRLSDVMSRFGRGDRGARAAEHGPGEIRAMATQFNQMASDLADQRAAQMAFLGGVAHDLRNPLGAMRLTIGLLRSDQGVLPREQIERAVSRLQRHLARVERMVDDFLDVARIEAGKLRIERQPCDLREVVSEAVALVDGAPTSQRVHLDLPPGPLPATVDAMRLEQALGNVIGNALKYSPEGGAVDVRARAAERDVVVEIADHGIGMNDEDRRRLFEPFRRVASADGIVGIGLGLYVTRGIVEAHGGAIEVESQIGRGSMFRIRLPATG